MDQYLELILSWFKKLAIDNINLDKLKRQLSIIANWFKHNGNGVLLAVTGFGKTMVAIITIYRLNLKLPDAKIIVVVPTSNLYEDWQKHIIEFGLKNVEVYVVNGYASEFIRTQIRYKCTLLIVDEVHNILSEEGRVFNQTLKATEYQMFLGLSATLGEEELAILQSLNIPIVDEVTMSEARRFNYISDYTIFNIGIELDAEEREYYNKINDIHNSNFGKFRYFVEFEKNYELIRACTAANAVSCKVGNDWKTGKQWREWFAEKQGFDGSEDHPWSPANIAKYAHQWNWAMTQRKEYIYKHPKKLELVKQIIERFKLPTITFGQVTDTADRLTEMIGDQARSYHSNVASTTEEVVKRVERKSYKSAKLLKQRTQGALEVDNSSGKPLYIVTYKEAVPVSKAKLLKRIKLEFEQGLCKYLNTAKALDEGYNVEGIEMAIIYAMTSTKRNFIQRIGRALRFIVGKRAIIIVIYIKESQEEKWIKNAQQGEGNIRYIDSIEEIC